MEEGSKQRRLNGQAQQEGERLLPLWFGKGAGEGTAPPPLFETEKGAVDAAPFSVKFVVA
jgi:hypothetical protein